MILSATTGYEIRAYAEAVAAMGLEAAFGSDRCHVLDDPWRDGALPLRFENPEASASQVVEYARMNPLDAIVPLGDRTVPTAARACQRLGLLSHPAEAADICRDKFRSRERLHGHGLNIPPFARYPLESDPRQILAQGGVQFPCVLKPLSLSASRGVIRANNAREFTRSFERIRTLLRSPDVQVMREETTRHIQAEGYIEGAEIAAEGFVDHGSTNLLAIFDKPDPLEGPYFEETLYVTPSRLSGEVQWQVAETLRRAIDALGLFHGPFHAELRINSKGVWPLEVAARSIGGLCARALRFRSLTLGENVSLEKLMVALALGTKLQPVRREDEAAGVMMIPVEQGGIYQGTEGLEEARAIPGIEDVIITAKPSLRLIPFPEGCSYPGFIFARGRTAEFVEAALRRAHQTLRFKIAQGLPVMQSGG